MIRIVAAMIMDDRGRTLVVRKRGTDAFMQAGGKLEEGDSSLNALRREIVEELGCHVVQGSECFLGCLQAEAANEPGATVEAQIYSIALASPPTAQAEIEELKWIDPNDPGSLSLAPLTREQVLPLARQAGVLR